MLGDVSFYNLLDLRSFRQGGKLRKLPIEQAIKAAHQAHVRGDKRIDIGRPVDIDFSSKRTPYFRLEGSIFADAWIYKTKKEGSGSFIRLELGLMKDTLDEEEGVQSASSKLMTLTGRVKDTSSGDQSVFFFDPAQNAYSEGFRDALQLVARQLKKDVSELLPDVDLLDFVETELSKSGAGL